MSTAGPALLAQRVNRRGRDDPFDAARQFRVQGYERVCLQLSECNVLGVVGRGPSQLIRQNPGPMLEHSVAQEPDPHPPDAGEAVARDVGRDLAPLDGLVQGRQRLGTQERRCEELVLAWDLDPRIRQVKDGAGVDDEPGHRVPAGDHVVASLPNPHAGRCGGGDDSKQGAYTHSGDHLFVLDQPTSTRNSLLVVEGETAVLSVVPPSAGWPQGAHPAMAVWSPTSETLYYRQGIDVWKWTAGSDPERYLLGVSWSYPTITPDGGHLAYTAASPDGTPDTYLIDLAHGGSPQMIWQGRSHLARLPELHPAMDQAGRRRLCRLPPPAADLQHRRRFRGAQHH